jgi:cyclophilin family peptidyl-prolyl cis-trans isomerase
MGGKAHAFSLGRLMKSRKASFLLSASVLLALPVAAFSADDPRPAPKPPDVVEEPPAPAQPLPRVKLTTAHGEIHADVEIELYEDDAPNTVANFIELCEKHFYDGLIFHRIEPGRWAQTGDPTGTGRGGPSYKFAHEIDAEALGLDKIVVKDFAARYKQKPAPGTEEMSLKELYEKQGFHYTKGLKSHPVTKGSVVMAYGQPDTNGSQFFVALNDCLWLNGKHTVFGRVVSGLEALKVVQKGDLVEKVEILSKRDHPYKVKTLEAATAQPKVDKK